MSRPNVLQETPAPEAVDITFPYRGRTFTIRADYESDHSVWFEAVGEHLPDGSVAFWDGSGVVYESAADCIAETIRNTMLTVDDEAQS